MSPDRVSTLITALEEWFSRCPSGVVALSGGIDSSLVAFLARKHLGRDKCLAVVGDSASLKDRDLQAARQFAAQHDIPLRVVATKELSTPGYRANGEDRCFHCKSVLFTQLETIRRETGFAHILGGENLDDHSDYRPGLKAAEDFKVRGPLAECSVTKSEVRAIARHFELACWEKPASPCLSSRIPYFNEVTEEKLRQIEAGETLLEARGFPVSRVRHHGDHARIEVPRESVGNLLALQPELLPAFRKLGFDTIEIDPEGFVSGKLNRVL